ncbi:hypothetical protein Tco_1077499 [Tanacetum coccineum]
MSLIRRIQRDSIRRIQSMEYNILEDIKHGPYSKKSLIRRDLDNSTSNVLIPLDGWASRLLVYKLPSSEKLEWWFEPDIDKEEERFEGDEYGGEV